MYVHGELEAVSQKLMIKITGLCQGVQIRTEALSNGELLSICNLIEIEELIPYQHSLYNIRTFEDFARFCIIPFIYFYTPSQNDETSQSEINFEPQITQLNVELR